MERIDEERIISRDTPCSRLIERCRAGKNTYQRSIDRPSTESRNRLRKPFSQYVIYIQPAHPNAAGSNLQKQVSRQFLFALQNQGGRNGCVVLVASLRLPKG